MTSHTPTEEQEIALQVLLSSIHDLDSEVTLSGWAGTGKTFLTGELVRRLRAEKIPFRLMSPTGRAASHMAAVTGEEASTIHSALYRSVREGFDGQVWFGDDQDVEIEGWRPSSPAVLLVDEASMVDREIRVLLLRRVPRGATIVWIGDPGQIRPVMGHMGPDLDHPDAILSTVHRQALDQPILRIATDVRSGGALPRGSVGHDYERASSDPTAVAQWMAEQRQQGRDATLLCWTNDLRHRLNRLVRRELGRKALVEVGDRLVVLHNNKAMGLMNGEVVEVGEIRPIVLERPPEEAGEGAAKGAGADEALQALIVRTTNDREIGVLPSLIGAKYPAWKRGVARLLGVPSQRFVHVDHGEAITFHKSQGSEYDIVGIVLDGALKKHAASHLDEVRRLIYVGVTRAKKVLRVFDVA